MTMLLTCSLFWLPVKGEARAPLVDCMLKRRLIPLNSLASKMGRRKGPERRLFSVDETERHTDPQ